MSNWIKTYGRLDYRAPRDNKRSDGDWLVMKADLGIALYYHKMVLKNLFNPFDQTPSPQNVSCPIHPHVTILDGRERVNNQYRKLIGKYQNEKVEIEYSNDIRLFWRFLILPVRCKLFDNIRSELGLGKMKAPYHLTIGKIETPNTNSELSRCLNI